MLIISLVVFEFVAKEISLHQRVHRSTMVHGMGKNSCPLKKVLEKIDRFEVWVIRCIGRFREWFSFYFCLCWRQKAVTEMFLKTKITSSAKPTLTFSISSVRIHVKIIQPVFLTVVEVWLMRLTNVRVWKVNILWLIKITCSIKGCPDGCPCPVYTCPSIKSSVLVLSTWTRINRSLVVDFAGNYHRVDFRIERTKEVFRSCSGSGCSFTEVTLPDSFLKLGLISRTKLLGIIEWLYTVVKIDEIKFSKCRTADLNVLVSCRSSFAPAPARQEIF